ncbi:MAG: hypothetical protein GF393_00390 [Armatimonadia bacterium]|nr:hypothetical protein [Armatimonadia bacterium]
MAKDSDDSRYDPLTRLVIGLKGCADTLQRFGLTRAGEGPDDPSQPISATSELEQFRQPAKDIIVWLELRGREVDAGEVDDAMSELYGVAHAYDAGELRDELSRHEDAPLTPLDQLIEAVNSAAGRLEDLVDSIPNVVWQGFTDA